MSQQLQITGGAKVRDLQDVIIGTSGVLSSLAFNVANGVPKLDVNGKILVSQLPNSVMEYQGTWNAATNTPTLVNGTGNQGDVYLCNVAGTTNFGAGPITFAVGDSAIYSGTIWQRAGGATGTVTSVGLTSTGNDAITITGSPITTSGNINLGFAGTNLQYINGAGDLTTFPTLISSIGLTMPSAFSVANSPLTANGTIAVTGAGYPSQYIRGDGTLADFPTSGGGGSSVSYYLNGGTSQGTIGGVTYYEMSKTADTGTMADFSLTGNGFIVAFLTDAGDPAQLNIPAGNWNYEIYASMSANGGTPEMYAELYKYDGTTFTLIATSPHEILYDGTALNLYTFAMTVPSTTLAITDRLAVKLYATNSGGKTTTVHTQDSHLCQIITTFSTGITALNGLTAQVQYFATGTSGTDFNISSATATHTFNIPDASATNRGLITTGTQTIAGAKTFSGGVTAISYYAQGNGTQGGYLYLKQGIVPYSTLTGSNSISADGTKYIFFSDAGSSNGKIALFELGSLTNNTARTYTLPDASGTLAILEASLQVFSGTVQVQGQFNTVYGISMQKGSTPTSFSFGDVFIYAASGTANILKIANNTYTSTLSFPTSNQTYTFPAADGTLALLEGTQTFTGLKTFGDSIQAGYGISLYNGIGTGALVSATYTGFYAAKSGTYTNITFAHDGAPYFSRLKLLNNATYDYTFPSASGTIALTSDITSAISGTTNYHAKFTGTNTIGNSLIWDNGTNVGIGNTNTSYTLDVSGTLRSTTSAYFATASGNVGIGTTTATNKLTITNDGNAANALRINDTNANASFLSLSASNTDAAIIANGTAAIPLDIYTGGVARMRVGSNGTVTVGNSAYAGTTTDLYITGDKVNANGYYSRLMFSNSSQSGSSSASIRGERVGGNYYTELSFYTNGTNATSDGTERMRITSGGSAYFGNAAGGALGGMVQIDALNGLGSGNDGLGVKTGGATNAIPILLWNAHTAGDIELTRFYTGASSNRGNIFYSTTNGQLRFSGAAAGTYSDARLKDIKGECSYGLDTISKIKVYDFNWLRNGNKGFGVKAQEIYDLIPEVVEVGNDKEIDPMEFDYQDIWKVNYNELVPVLVKAIQEQQIQIQNLQEQINILAK